MKAREDDIGEVFVGGIQRKIAQAMLVDLGIIEVVVGLRRVTAFEIGSWMGTVFDEDGVPAAVGGCFLPALVLLIIAVGGKVIRVGVESLDGFVQGILFDVIAIRGIADVRISA